jgi:hypothetical protein
VDGPGQRLRGRLPGFPVLLQHAPRGRLRETGPARVHPGREDAVAQVDAGAVGEQLRVNRPMSRWLRYVAIAGFVSFIRSGLRFFGDTSPTPVQLHRHAHGRTPHRLQRLASSLRVSRMPDLAAPRASGPGTKPTSDAPFGSRPHKQVSAALQRRGALLCDEWTCGNLRM